ncbi:MAG TPA: ABC transporter permease subunit, partial [Isosphaeraceae bacterium]|nr:ABC transporter permease subunit [Isosphaeraceae bacterium]
RGVEWELDPMMPIGPILSRELVRVARLPSTFRRRCSLSIAVLLLLGSLYLLVSVTNRSQLPGRSMALFSESVFVNVVFTQMVLTIVLVPASVAVTIAEEKERRTLTQLLTTRLTSAEIVLGKLGAGLVQYAAWLTTGLPVMILLPLLGGVDPGWILMATAGTGSTAYFVAGLSIAVSIAAPRAANAVAQTIGLAMLWVILPLLVQLIVPFWFPRLWHWAHPANTWVLASSPSGVLLAALGIGPGWRLFDSIVWMIGLQFAAGSVLIVWAVARFRGVCRRHEDFDGTASGEGRLQVRLRAAVGQRFLERPPCGENPMLWKELHTSRRRSLAEILGVLGALGLVAGLGYATFVFARPAVWEQIEYGFGPAAAEVRRTEFNQFLRIVTSWVEFFAVLAAAGIAATGLTEERARETWDSLLATPLNAREIVWAKMIGAAWRVRWVALLLVALWFVGMAAGSIHPLGVGAAIVLLVVSIWFAAALGTHASLVSRDTAQASNRALIPILLLSCSFLVCYVARRNTTVALGAGSAPFVNWLSLVSHADVREVVVNRAQKPFSPIRTIGLYTDERPSRALATFLLAAASSTFAAAWLSLSAVANFDRFTGRPGRRNAGVRELGARADRLSRRDKTQHESGLAERRPAC